MARKSSSKCAAVGCVARSAREPWHGAGRRDRGTIVADDRVRSHPVGFVSLGCPKALTDSELILTQLARRGLRDRARATPAPTSSSSTPAASSTTRCKESLDTIGEALAEPTASVIVTGCLGAKAGDGGGNLVRQVHPKVLAVTGPHATQEVMDAVHRTCPSRTTRSSTWCRQRAAASSSRRATTPT
ncbi:MAG: hypothetical protein MZW92_75090 [Comamonadaceae bacterium]|nr:hypothetical protein [Comamonadaceae bacterium]